MHRDISVNRAFSRRESARRVLKVEELEPRLLLSHTSIVGHRGNSGLAPENTLVSLRQAFEAGADVVEADVQFTADGAIVLMHDITVDRTTDGAGLVAELTLGEIERLDAGSWMGPEFAGERVPTLREALEAAAGRGPVYLDIKSDAMGAAIKQILSELELSDGAVWASTNLEYQVQDIHANLPGTLITWWGDVPDRPDADYFQRMRTLGVTGFDLEWGHFSRSFVKAARASGMLFATYAIDDPSDWRRALRWDLDAIETNFPGRLADFVAGPSDNVSVEFSDGQLFIRGDHLSNNIRIESDGPPDSLRVVGVHGTTVNDNAEPVGFARVRSVHVLLGRGDDVVRIVDAVLDELFIDSGGGGDHVGINRSQVGGAEVTTSAGSDIVWAEDSVLDRFVLDGGSGRDRADLGVLSVPNARQNLFDAAPVIQAIEALVS